ncbi:MAG: HDIG domain-containing protein [Planctomycetota bacterium]|nr:MAG: HDIG domain-containing protein [Planctomycetota bacterium]
MERRIDETVRGAIAERLAELRRLLAERPAPAVLPEREAAKRLLFEHTTSPALRAHMLAVEAAMAAYARRLGGEEPRWRLAGLLHDLDYEQNPDPARHPLVGCAVLARAGYPEDVIEAILGHASYTGVPRTSPMAKALYAVDELVGLLTAIAYVRPGGLAGLSWSSFQKKFKSPSFAAGVDRAEVLAGARELGVQMPEHVAFVAAALQAAFPEFPRVPEAEG